MNYVPFYKGKNILFDASPSVISVCDQHVTLSQKFHERSFIDKDGYYKLEHITSNYYTI